MKANGFLASGWSSLPVRKDRVSVGRKPTVTSVARALVWSASSRVEGRRDGAQVALSAKVEETLAVASYLTGTTLPWSMSGGGWRCRRG